MKNKIDDLLSDIVFDENQIDKVMKKIEEENPLKINHGFGKSKKISTLLIAVILIVGLTGFVFALDLPQKLLKLANEHFEILDRAVVDQGIELKVIGAFSDKEMGEIYFTLRDLEENRISATTLPECNISGSSFTGLSMFDYDEAQKVATYKISIQGAENLQNKELRLHLSALKEVSELTEDGFDINLYDMSKTFEPFELAPSDIVFWNAQNHQGIDLSDKLSNLDIQVSAEDDLDIVANNTPWLTVKKLAYFDGLLYVRTLIKENKLNERSYVFVKDTSDTSLVYPIVQRSSIPNDYNEFIIEVGDIKNLKTAKLAAFVNQDGEAIEGSWYTSFKLEGVRVKTTNCSIDLDGSLINSIDLSPLGIVLRGESTFTNNPLEKLPLSILLKNGSIITPHKPPSTTKANEVITGRWAIPQSIKAEDIKAVIVNEQQVNVN